MEGKEQPRRISFKVGTFFQGASSQCIRFGLKVAIVFLTHVSFISACSFITIRETDMECYAYFLGMIILEICMRFFPFPECIRDRCRQLFEGAVG